MRQQPLFGPRDVPRQMDYSVWQRLGAPTFKTAGRLLIGRNGSSIVPDTITRAKAQTLTTLHERVREKREAVLLLNRILPIIGLRAIMYCVLGV